MIDRWPAELARIGAIDAADRRRADAASGWRRAGRMRRPTGFVCAAGISDPAPAVARLLRRVAELPEGSVVFHDLALEMPDEEWDALGPHKPDPDTGLRKRSIETHPQFQLKLLLDRVGAGRGEVRQWPAGSDHDASLARGRAIANALAPADFTGKWTTLDADRRRLAGIRAVELATAADEAQAIALALREALETPERTAALVTPDRALAERVAAHCARWGIAIDDTAGSTAGDCAPGTLLTVLAEAAAQDFAPAGVARLDQASAGPERSRRARCGSTASARSTVRLRGPRPAPGLDGIDAHLREGDEREADIRAAALLAWPDIRALLEPIARCFGDGDQPLAAMVATLARNRAGAVRRRAVGRTGRPRGGGIARGPGGRGGERPADRRPRERRAVAPHADGGGRGAAAAGRASAAGDLWLDRGAVADRRSDDPGRAQRRHLARPSPQPDPWLAPRIRAELGLPGLERSVGVAAHDFANALGAPQVLITRARRDGRSPTLASRFWLRLEALAGERFEHAPELC